jgi:hypothetical protein
VRGSISAAGRESSQLRFTDSYLSFFLLLQTAPTWRTGIECPDLVAAVEHQFAQQIGKDFVLEDSLTGAWLGHKRLNTHLEHQCAHMKPAHLVALPASLVFGKGISG